jgi:hypothetical protein
MVADFAFARLTGGKFGSMQGTMIKIANILVVGRRMGRMV